MRRMAVLLILVPLLMAIFVSPAEPRQQPRIRCFWRAPTSGEPVVLYHLHIMDLDGGLDTTYVVPAQPGPVQEFFFVHGDYVRRYVAEVAGMDASGDMGPWADWSSVYSFEVADPE